MPQLQLSNKDWSNKEQSNKDGTKTTERAGAFGWCAAGARSDDALEERGARCHVLRRLGSLSLSRGAMEHANDLRS